jgi:hypothetical protein
MLIVRKPKRKAMDGIGFLCHSLSSPIHFLHYFLEGGIMKKNINVFLSFSIIVACRVVLKTKWQAGHKCFWEDILLILFGLSGRETWVPKRKNMLNSDFLSRIMCLYQETIISTLSNIITCLHNLLNLAFTR